MARGDSKKFAAYENAKGDGDYNNSADTFAFSFITETFAAVDANALSASLGDFTAVASSGNYVAGTAIANTTWTQVGDTSTLDGDGITFAADPANPTTARCMVIYNDTSVGDSAFVVVDLTTDGSTPVDTTQGFTANIPNGIATVQANA